MPYFSLNKREIQNIFTKNVSYNSGPIQCLGQKTTLSLHFAVAISRQIGRKNHKTKIKRQIRSLVLSNPGAWKNWNIVFVIHKNYFECSYLEIAEHLKHLSELLNQKNLSEN